ncbi:MAG: ribonuclease E/G, partial [Gammaproteobacteria bacterium]
ESETVSTPVTESDVIAAPIQASETLTEAGADTKAQPTPVVDNEVMSKAAPLQPTAQLNKAELEQMLSSAGMLWVETDHEKWSVVQSNLAAAPKPVRVPRERKPVVQIASENLVLVETKPEFRSGSN